MRPRQSVYIPDDLDRYVRERGGDFWGFMAVVIPIIVVAAKLGLFRLIIG